MGTAAVLLASGHELPKEVKGIIADCGFHSMKQQLRDMASEWFHLHWIELLLIRVDLFCRIFAGFKMKDADTTDALKHNKLPILFISARQSDDDILIALSIGGDDYIKKPYSLSVLLAKVKVTLKRIAESAGASAQAEAGVPSDKEALSLDPSTMSVMVREEHIPLKAREYALLEALYKHKNTIVSKDRLFEEVWGDGYYSDGTLNVHIRKLREKIEEDPNNRAFIKTVWGTGYILEL
jgi:DNA-binding response OmpR family regulator